MITPQLQVTVKISIKRKTVLRDVYVHMGAHTYTNPQKE